MVEHADKLRFGVVVPSTNTVAEDEFAAMCPPTVSLHSARLQMWNPQLGSSAGMEAAVASAIDAVPAAIQQLDTLHPDHIIVGMSIETLWGASAGAASFRSMLAASTNTGVTTAADASIAALRALRAKRVGLLTPYPQVGNSHLIAFLEEHGFVAGPVVGPTAGAATELARVRSADLVPGLESLKASGVDTVLQFCTNLPFLSLADEETRSLGIPVIAITSATFWHALRTVGVSAQMEGCGALMQHF